MIYGNRWLNKANFNILGWAILAFYWIYLIPLWRSHMYTLPKFKAQIDENNRQLLLASIIVWSIIFIYRFYRESKSTTYFVLNADTLTIKNYLRFTTVTYAISDIESMAIEPGHWSYSPSIHLTLKNGAKVNYTNAVLSKKEWQRFVNAFNTHGFLLDYAGNAL